MIWGTHNLALACHNFQIMVKVSSSDILDELDLLESDDIALVEELLDSTIEKGAPLSLKYRPREGRGNFFYN